MPGPTSGEKRMVLSDSPAALARSLQPDQKRRIEDNHWARREIKPVEAKEEYLQAIFDTWNTSRPRMAGAPSWLSNARAERHAEREFVVPPVGDHIYKIRPDLVWEELDRTLVIELKRGAKYEPLALAEVMHHAWALAAWPEKNGVKLPAEPVIISQQNYWHRGAIAGLMCRGLESSMRNRYLEVDLLRGSNGQDLLWFDLPLADDWNAVDVEHIH